MLDSMLHVAISSTHVHWHSQCTCVLLLATVVLDEYWMYTRVRVYIRTIHVAVASYTAALQHRYCMYHRTLVQPVYGGTCSSGAVVQLRS